MTTKANDPLCLACKEHERKCSGLCGACYQMALKEVKAGTTTWQKLIRAGRAIRSKRGPRSRWANAKAG